VAASVGDPAEAGSGSEGCALDGKWYVPIVEHDHGDAFRSDQGVRRTGVRLSLRVRKVSKLSAAGIHRPYAASDPANTGPSTFNGTPASHSLYILF
jgi:hypothetical protein